MGLRCKASKLERLALYTRPLLILLNGLRQVRSYPSDRSLLLILPKRERTFPRRGRYIR